jgi:hypothetical protein
MEPFECPIISFDLSFNLGLLSEISVTSSSMSGKGSDIGLENRLNKSAVYDALIHAQSVCGER